MKQLTKNGIAIALQVVAVIFLFGYNGCSSNDKSKADPIDNISVLSKTVVLNK